METTLYLIRHGEAADADDTDPGLTERGTAQAAAVGDRLNGLQFDGILHSSRRRAQQTAGIAGALLGPTPQHSPHADDRTPIPSDQSGLSANLRAFLADVPDDERDPDGHCLDRSIEELSWVASTIDRHVLIVTHNFVIAWFVRDALDAPIITWTRLNSANGALTIVRYRTDEPARLITFNDTGHLPSQ
ncbi:MAG: histidine phosphatase family protein [Acidimicrobiales bacterium]|jgi:serine/threonine-protein phosphatase PGAM5|nr:histidine phosphatase family protein [Acidimicrobiales bacterium]